MPGLPWVPDSMILQVLIMLLLYFSAKIYEGLRECEIACKGFFDALDEFYERIDKISEDNVARLAKLAELKRKYPYQREAVQFRKQTVRVTNKPHANEAADADSNEQSSSLSNIILTHYKYDRSEKSVCSCSENETIDLDLTKVF